MERDCYSPVEIFLPGKAQEYLFQGTQGYLEPHDPQHCCSLRNLIALRQSMYLAGGPERWHVISVCCGGRHSLALAVPDNEASSVSSARASRMASRSGSAELQQLPPGEPLDSATDREGSATDRDDAVADGESSATTRDNPATNRNGSRTADEADGRPPVPAGNLNGMSP